MAIMVFNYFCAVEMIRLCKTRVTPDLGISVGIDAIKSSGSRNPASATSR